MTRALRFMVEGFVPRRLSDFANDRRGVSAVEFALLLPLMLTLYLGGVELSQGISIDRKVTLTARTVADLVAQAQSVSTATTADANAALGASAAILAPYPIDSAKIVVSVIDIDKNGNAKVRWSSAKNTSARAAGSSVTLPTALNVPETSLVWGEASYNYQPSIGYVVTGAMNLNEQIFMRPRIDNAT
jgi:Flp pilus assembly protein TadG